MEITRLLPDDDAGCAEAVALLTATHKIDSPDALLPTPRGFAHGLRYGWDQQPVHTYLARENGTVVGMLYVELSTYDNRNLIWLEVSVHPDHRRRGLGSALIRFGERLGAELDRTSVGLAAWDTPAAIAFARRHGYEQKAIEVNRRQDIAGLDWTVVERLHEQAVAASEGYELLRITGELPEELLDGMVAVTASINDAPKDDLDIEDDKYSPERLRAYEKAQLSSGRNLYRVIAREKATGALAGHSTITVEQERPHIAEQNDTAVSREHRGHRLGALVKTAMLLWMRDQEPALTQLDTWNAESNSHMIGINEQLNYRVVARALDFQKQL